MTLQLLGALWNWTVWKCIHQELGGIYIVKEIRAICKVVSHLWELLNSQHFKSVQVCSNIIEMWQLGESVPFLFLLVASEKQLSHSGLVFWFLYYLIVQTFCTVQCCLLFSLLNITSWWKEKKLLLFWKVDTWAAWWHNG